MHINSNEMFSILIFIVIGLVIATLIGSLILFLTARALKVPNTRYFPSLGVVVCSALVKGVIVFVLTLILTSLFNGNDSIGNIISAELVSILTTTLFVMLFFHVDKVKAFLVSLIYTIICDVLVAILALIILLPMANRLNYY